MAAARPSVLPLLVDGAGREVDLTQSTAVSLAFGSLPADGGYWILELRPRSWQPSVTRRCDVIRFAYVP
ncbi:uncharacterized [Tachysurus ichikawai]